MPAVRGFPFLDILGWSNSRYDLFTACRRHYYYQYYYRFDTDFDQAQLAQLRELTSVPLQIGNLSHDCIASLLRRLQKDPNVPIDREKLSEFVSRKTHDGVAISRFSEVYYRQASSVDVELLASEVNAALNNLLGADRFVWLTKVAAETRQDWVIEPDRYGETRIDGMKAYCKVDFLFPVREILHIIDWKTGKERTEKHASQIRGYAAWASYHFSRPVSGTRPVIAYLLPEYHEMAAELNDHDMEQFAKMVHAQTEEMYALCADIEKNIPRPKQAFPLTKIESLCAYCNFRELCKRS